MTAPLALLAFAALAAALVPRRLSRSPWPERSPLLGIVLWQALTLSVVAAIVLAGTALAVPEVPFTTDIAGLLSACAVALRAQYSTPGGAVISVGGAVLAVTVLSRVGYCLVASLLGARRARRRQAQMLSAVAPRHADSEALVSSMDHRRRTACRVSGSRWWSPPERWQP